MHILLFTTILLVAIARAGIALPLDTARVAPVPIVDVVRSSAGRASLDTVDAVIRCTLHDPSDVIEFHLGKPSSSTARLPYSRAIEHRLKLDGVLTDWIMIDGGIHRIHGVKPGVYNLRVQARYPGGAWGPEQRIHLHVDQRQGSSWWIYAMVIALVVPSAWYGRRLMQRRAQLQRLEHDRIRAEERRRIARDLHDDVGSGLARIVVLSDAVAAADGSETAATIAETAREVIESVRTIVWVMKSENDSVAATLAYVRDRVAELLRDHGIAFTYIEEMAVDCLVNANARWNVMMCIKEIATNIVRHSKATTVSMHVSCEQSYVSIQITDNGVGFSSDALGVGRGLTHIRERMSEIGGTAGIGSRPDEGTNILLVIPIDRQARAAMDVPQ